MTEKKRKKITLMFLLTSIILVITVVSYTYAAISSTLKINGVNIELANMDAAVWNIKYQNLSNPTIVGEAVINMAPTLNDTLIGTFSIIFKKPNDSASYNFNIVNKGNIDAKIGTFIKKDISCIGKGKYAEEDAKSVCDNLIYTIKYTINGKDIKEEDLLASGESINVTLTLKYIGEVLPKDKVEITGLGITIVYIQE